MGLLAKSSGKPLDVHALMDSAPLHDALWEVVQLGAMLTFSATKNGAAIGVTVTFDGEWDREWFKTTDEIVEWMAEILPELRRAVEARDASSDRGNRSRRRRAE